MLIPLQNHSLIRVNIFTLKHDYVNKHANYSIKHKIFCSYCTFVFQKNTQNMNNPNTINPTKTSMLRT